MGPAGRRARRGAGHPGRREKSTAERILVEVPTAAEGRDLIDALARRGLTGALVRSAGRWHVEVHYEREETGRLLLDVAAVLRTWMLERDLDPLTLRVGGETRLLDPREDLEAALRARAAGEAPGRPSPAEGRRRGSAA